MSEKSPSPPAGRYVHLLQEVPTAVEVVEITTIVAFANCRRKFNHALGIESNGVCLLNKAIREEVWVALLPGRHYYTFSPSKVARMLIEL